MEQCKYLIKSSKNRLIVFSVYMYLTDSTYPTISNPTMISLTCSMLLLETPQPKPTFTKYRTWLKSFFTLQYYQPITVEDHAAHDASTSSTDDECVDLDSRLVYAKQHTEACELAHIRMKGTGVGLKCLAKRIESAKEWVVSAEESARIARIVSYECEILRNGFQLVKSIKTLKSKQQDALLIEKCYREADEYYNTIHKELEGMESEAERSHHILQQEKKIANDALEDPTKLNNSNSFAISVNEAIEGEPFDTCSRTSEILIKSRVAQNASGSKYGDSIKRSNKRNVVHRLSTSNGEHTTLSPTFKGKKKPWWSRYSKSKNKS